MTEPTHVVIVNGEPQEVTAEIVSSLEQQAEEIAQQAQQAYQANIENFRRAAYTTEADPIFFKMQRGEATQAEWLAKIAEIKQRYPAT